MVPKASSQAWHKKSTSSAPLSPGQFLLEQSRLGEAAEMAERAAELDSSEFDVVFSAAHMLRLDNPRLLGKFPHYWKHVTWVCFVSMPFNNRI